MEAQLGFLANVSASSFHKVAGITQESDFEISRLTVKMRAICATLFPETAITTGRLFLEFVILTASRSGEARGICREEFDPSKAIWTVPASRMKAKTAHRVSLSPQAQEILRFMAIERGGFPNMASLATLPNVLWPIRSGMLSRPRITEPTFSNSFGV